MQRNENACIGCARGKRRCGKQQPQCLRCRTRGIGCRYPASKPSSFVKLVEQQNDNTEDLCWTNDGTNFRAPDLSASASIPLSDSQSALWWFAGPETWTIDHHPPDRVPGPDTFSSTDLKRLLETMLRWLKQWIAEGHNPFIHRQLYRQKFPACIQDAFMALSSWLHKTDANEHIVERIIENRVTQLVAHGLPLSIPSTSPELAVDVSNKVDQLAHVQALLIYQCIGFLDGSPRLRHLAEQQISALETWIFTLMAETSFSLINQSCSTSPVLDRHRLWHIWILTESIRRTFLLIAGIQGIYLLIQKRIGSCLGAPVFTSRTGFWEAETAAVWEQRCMESYAGMVRLTQVEDLFEMVPKTEISEFARVVFECTYGVEQVEEWGILA